MQGWYNRSRQTVIIILCYEKHGASKKTCNAETARNSVSIHLLICLFRKQYFCKRRQNSQYMVTE